jgi:hypothetical protein
MAKEETLDDGSGLEEVQVTIVVVPGRVRATLAKLVASARVRAGLVCVAVIAAVVAGAIIAALSLASGGRAGRPLGSGALARQFGLRLNCSRRTVVSADGAYARIDLDHAGPCGTFGNQVTLVLHRLHGVWVRELEASSWRCPVRGVPQAVAIELQLCSSNRVASSTGAALSKIPLER